MDGGFSGLKFFKIILTRNHGLRLDDMVNGLEEINRLTT